MPEWPQAGTKITQQFERGTVAAEAILVKVGDGSGKAAAGDVRGEHPR